VWLYCRSVSPGVLPQVFTTNYHPPQYVGNIRPTPTPLTTTFSAGVRRLLVMARPYTARLTLAASFVLLSTALSLSQPLLARITLDEALKTAQVAILNKLGLGLVILIVLNGAVTFGQSVILSHTANAVARDLRVSLFSNLQRQPVSFFDTALSGQLMARFSNELGLIQQVLTTDLVGAVGSVVKLIAAITLAVALDWKLTIGVLSCAIAATIALSLPGKHLRSLTRRGYDVLSEAIGQMMEALGHVRVVKAFSREPHEEQRAAEALARASTIIFENDTLHAAHSGSIGLLWSLIFAAVLWYGARSVLTDDLTVGSLAALLMTLSLIREPMTGLSILYVRLNAAVGAADRLFGLLNGLPEEPDPPDVEIFPEGRGHIAFEQVTFSYAPGIPVLRALSLEVPAGSVTAVVGASGAGKTTLTQLLLRFYEPQSGAISIDGVPIRRLPRRQLRERIGLVPQEAALFRTTLRENIRYGRLDATDEDVEAAARAAHVHEFAANLPNGYDTLIGERGSTLSGGQRQRVAIARVFLKNPRIIILDEATSSLDSESEALVEAALNTLMEGRTTVLIAHRLSTVRRADRIHVIQGGRVIESGSHKELLRARGRYALLHARR
jgi:ATP-binding cassette, subfamily B, bacterial MsbA